MTDKTFNIYFTWCEAQGLTPSHYSTLKAFMDYYFRGLSK